jgi:hypothetical protein
MMGFGRFLIAVFFAILLSTFYFLVESGRRAHVGVTLSIFELAQSRKINFCAGESLTKLISHSDKLEKYHKTQLLINCFESL